MLRNFLSFLCLVVVSTTITMIGCTVGYEPSGEPTEIEGTVDIGDAVVIDGVIVSYPEIPCFAPGFTKECPFGARCVLSDGVTDSRGMTTLVCVAECEVDTVVHADGSVDIVPGTDSCDRFGQTEFFCDPTIHLCRTLTKEEKKAEKEADDACEGEGEGEGEDPTPAIGSVEIECCYERSIASQGYFGAFGWGPAGAVGADRVFAPARNLSVSSTSGCFHAVIDQSVVTIGYWVDPVLGRWTSDRTAVWDDCRHQPRACYIDGESVTVGTCQHGKGWPFGPAAR